MALSLVNGVNVTFVGLVDLVHSGEDVTIDPIQPGHYESYDLSKNGKVTHKETIKFHKFTEGPVYKTYTGPLGKCCINFRVYYQFFFFNIMVYYILGILLSFLSDLCECDLVRC